MFAELSAGVETRIKGGPDPVLSLSFSLRHVPSSDTSHDGRRREEPAAAKTIKGPPESRKKEEGPEGSIDAHRGGGGEVPSWRGKIPLEKRKC